MNGQGKKGKSSRVWWSLSHKMPKLIVIKMLKEAKVWYSVHCHLLNAEAPGS